MGRISGPLLDRIDLHIEVPQVKFCEISGGRRGESSRVIRDRVISARQRQQARFKEKPKITCNARVGPVIRQEGGHVEMDKQPESQIDEFLLQLNEGLLPGHAWTRG